MGKPKGKKTNKSDKKTENKVIKKENKTDLPASASIKNLEKRIEARQLFACKWKNCISIFIKDTDLYEHVRNHLPDIEITDGELKPFSKTT